MDVTSEEYTCNINQHISAVSMFPFFLKFVCV